jgi:predicted SAM-dependent methyltransferase
VLARLLVGHLLAGRPAHVPLGDPPASAQRAGARDQGRAVSDTPIWLNIGCGTHRAPAPWVNTDVVENESTHPDVIVPTGEFPWPDGSAERVYLGHVLEHMYWGPPLVAFLEGVRRVLAPGGMVLAVGPDYVKTLHGWREGRYAWDLAESVCEHARGANDLVGDWPEARHHWNCSGERMMTAFHCAGFERAVPMEGGWDGQWPVVGWEAGWQSAVWAEV